MPAKPIPGLGLVLGVILGYLGIVGANYATTRLALVRAMVYKTDFARSLPWIALLLAIAVILGVLMAIPAIGAGVMVGTGGLMTVIGLAFLLLPVRTVFDMMKLFEVPGARPRASYIFFDGSLLLLGLIVLIAGLGRWVSDAKVAKALQAQGRAQDNRGYQPTFPGQPNPQQGQWGGYPGQQQRPGGHPGQQAAGYPGQQQAGAYPGRQQQPGGYPGQHQPGHQQPGQQQPPGGHPGQQPPPGGYPGQH
jgi:hypothetical protein